MKRPYLLRTSPDGRRIAAFSGNEPAVPVWSVADPESPPLKLGNVNDLDFSHLPFDQLGERQGSFFGALDVSRDGRRAALGNTPWTGKVKLVNLGEDELKVPYLSGHKGGIGNAKFSPDGSRLVTGGDDNKTAWLWRADNPAAPPVPLVGSPDVVERTYFTPDGKRLITISYSGALIWSIEGSPKILGALRGHSGKVSDLKFSPDGDRFIAVGRDNIARLWWVDKPDEEPVLLRGHGSEIFEVAFSPDGRRLLTLARNGRARLWWVDRPSVEPLFVPAHSDDSFQRRCAAFVDGGKKLLFVAWDGRGRYWNLETNGQPPYEPADLIPNDLTGIRQTHLSSDGQWLITQQVPDSSKSRSLIRLWRVNRSSEDPVVFEQKSDFFQSVWFSPDQARLITQSVRDQSYKLWLVTAAKVVRVPIDDSNRAFLEYALKQDREAPVTSDGTRLIGEKDQPVMLVRQGEREPEPVVISGRGPCEFSPDGKRLLTKGDGLKVWTIPVEELIERVGDTLSVNFTHKEWSHYFPDDEFAPTFSFLPVFED